MVKMDAEGFEMDVLAGGVGFLSAHRPVMLGEFSPAWLETRGVDPAAPLSWAEANGYVCSELVYARRHPLSERKTLSPRPLGPLDRRLGASLLLVPRDATAPGGP